MYSDYGLREHFKFGAAENFRFKGSQASREEDTLSVKRGHIYEHF